MSVFRFENSEFLYALLLIPIFIIFYYYIRIWRKRALARYGDIGLVSRLIPDVSKYKPGVKFTIIMLALAAFIFGVANPQIGSKLQEYKRQGIDVVIVLDISNSMKSEDVRPNRLERAKQAISRLIDKLYGDRIGIVIFAGESFLQLPITSDYSAAKLLLSTVDTDLIPTQGTALGGAIELADKSFKKEDKTSKAIIIITDGENHEDDAVGAAREAAKKGIFIYTIGIGSINGAPVPVFNRGQRVGFMKDNEGNVIISKLNATMLEQLAGIGNGKFIRSADTEPDLTQLMKDIEKMDKKEYKSRLFSDYEDRFQYLLFLAMFFLVIEFFISEQKNKYIESWNLFGERKYTS